MYPHIPAQHFFGCRVAVIRNFIRSDLCLKRWFQIATSGTGNEWLGTSNLELTRDGILIVLKDNSRVLKEDLSE